jgi:hypothetical protein
MSSCLASFGAQEGPMVEQLNFHLSRTMATATQEQLREVLCKTFHLGAFLGGEAVSAFKALFYKIEHAPGEEDPDSDGEEEHFGPATPAGSPPQGAAAAGADPKGLALDGNKRIALKDTVHASKSAFEGRIGFGDPAVPLGAVMAAVGKRPPVRVAYLDSVKHKNRYDMSHGKTLGYLLHRRLFSKVDTSKDGSFKIFEEWLIDLLRSPLRGVEAVVHGRVPQHGGPTPPQLRHCHLHGDQPRRLLHGPRMPR